MSIFSINQQTPAVTLANRYLISANGSFDALLSQTKSDFNNFWFGHEEVTPIQVIEAMGTKAQAFFAVAYARVQMLVQIAQFLGKPELVTESELLPPFVLVFNEDGSLASATPKE